MPDRDAPDYHYNPNIGIECKHPNNPEIPTYKNKSKGMENAKRLLQKHIDQHPGVKHDSSFSDDGF